MNLDLLESFGQHFPEEADGFLDCSSMAVCCSFNRWGSLLGVGCNDGRVAIFDIITRGVAKVIAAHVQPVVSLSWSRNGRKLLSASTDNSVALWNVLTGDCEKRFRFPSPILRVQFHPRDQSRFIVCPMRLPTVLVNANEGTHVNVPFEDDMSGELGVNACFDRRGRHILTGNCRGKIAVYASDTLHCAASFRLPSNHAVKTVVAGRRGDYFLTNSADRTIRVFDLREVLLRGRMHGPLEPVQKLQDIVNKTPWKTCCLSGDGDYICAGSAKAHSLYIWEKNSGNLVKILTGTKGELLLDVQWHPARPLICSVSNGVVSMWSQSHVENWSAFAPDFKELDENVEYEERESEFDLEDEDRSVELNPERPSEEAVVDVVSVRPVAALCSSDEEDIGAPSPLWFLPITPEVDQPEENPYLPTLPESLQLSGDQNRAPTDLSKKKPGKTFDIHLHNAPADEIHPLLVGSGKKRSSGGSQSRQPAKQRKINSK